MVRPMCHWRLPLLSQELLHSFMHIIRQGKGLAEINHMLIEVTVGDKVFVPKGVSQRVTNTGTKDLEFYCICLPRFVPDCYINLDNAID